MNSKEQQAKTVELAKKLALQIIAGYKVVIQDKAKNIFNFFMDDEGVQLYELCFDHEVSEKIVLATHCSKSTIHVFIISGTIEGIKQRSSSVLKICMFKLNIRSGTLQMQGIDAEVFHAKFSQKSFPFFLKAHKLLFEKSKKIQHSSNSSDIPVEIAA